MYFPCAKGFLLLGGPVWGRRKRLRLGVRAWDTREADVGMTTTPLRVLLIEDNQEHSTAMSDELRRSLGATVLTVTSGEDALTELARNTYEMVVMDFSLPGMDGLSVLRSMGERRFDVPVVLVTGMGDEQTAVRALKAGAYDYVVKGQGLDFVRQLPGAVADALKAFQVDRQRQDTVRQLSQERERLAELSIRDDLTELFNRRHLASALPSEFERARRYHYPLSAMMTDIDGLKAINSEHGHRCGSAVIRHVAGVIWRGVRISDVCFRYGGDEFLLLLPSTPVKGALTLGRRLCRLVAEAPLDFEGDALSLSISIGVATFHRESYRSHDELLRASDRALFQAKAAGGNTVVEAEAPSPAVE